MSMYKNKYVSDSIFTVLSNDSYNNYFIVGSAFKFAPSREQLQICSFIRLENMLIWKMNENRWNKKAEKDCMIRFCLDCW